ncbi:MAG: sporulation protein YunB [Anaeroplasma sp.]
MLKMLLKRFLFNKYFLFIILPIILLIAFIIRYFSSSVDNYISSNVKNYAEALVVRSIDSEIIDRIEDSDFLKEHYDSNGFVSYAYVDTKKMNEVRNNVSDYINAVMEDIALQEEITSVDIPLGYFLGTKYFLNNDLAIPIKLEILGDQDVDICKNTFSTGINTTIIEFYLAISISIKVVMPLKVKQMTIDIDIPLSMEVMNNEIPYYLGEIKE